MTDDSGFRFQMAAMCPGWPPWMDKNPLRIRSEGGGGILNREYFALCTNPHLIRPDKSRRSRGSWPRLAEVTHWKLMFQCREVQGALSLMNIGKIFSFAKKSTEVETSFLKWKMTHFYLDFREKYEKFMKRGGEIRRRKRETRNQAAYLRIIDRKLL